MGTRVAFQEGLIALTLCLCLGCPSFPGSTVEHGNVAMSISPSGKTIVFSDAQADLWLFGLTTKTATRLTSSSEQESTPSFSPDGKTIVYAATSEDGQGTSIFSRSIDGDEVRRLTHDQQVSDFRPCFAPDGKSIAFARAHLHRPYSMGGWTWDDWDVCVMDKDGGNLRRVTQNKHYGINGVLFSSDGQTLFYSAEADRRASDPSVTVLAVSVDNPEVPEIVTSKPGSAGNHYAWASDPALSPDGKQFVFISDRETPFHYDLVRMDRQTGQTTSLGVTHISRYNQNPVITPDGTKVLFLAGTEWNAGSRPIFSLWSIGMDGRNAVEIADSGLFTDPAGWQPNP